MSPMASETAVTLNLFTRWTNARNDLYIYVTNVTDKTVDIALSDNEGESNNTFTVGDILYLNDGAWVLTSTALDDETRAPWSTDRVPNAVFSRYF